MFLETEASFPYCNWSTKVARIIWLGSTSVQHVNNWQRSGRLPFLSLCKSRKFLETKTNSFISIKKKIICKKKFTNIWCKYGLHKYLPQAQQHLPPLYTGSPAYYYPHFGKAILICTFVKTKYSTPSQVVPLVMPFLKLSLEPL